MAFAVLKFRRGNTPTTTLAEPYFNTDKDTLQIGNNGTTVTLLKTGTNTGSLHLTGDITASNALLSGDITIQGNIILGDSVANDNININAELSGSLIPDAHNTHNLGSNSKRWKNLYAVSASIDDISLPGSGIVSSSQQISNYNTFLEINGDGVFSGSSQVVLNDADKTGFDTADVSENSSYLYYTDTRVKTKLNTEGVISGSSQITDGSGIVSSSQQISNYNTFLEINGDGVISGSSQVNADSITNFDSNVKDKLNTDGVISGSTQITDSSGIVSSSEQISNYNTFLEINGDGVVSGSSQITIGDVSGFTNYSSSINQQLDSIHTYTSSLKTAVDVSGQNLTVYGNLTVQGTQTSLNTNDLIVEDKLIAVASGSTTSAQADGAGLFISGANKSITWDDTNSNILINANVSSSVGFEGDGSNLTGITADSVQWTNITSKPSGLVSGSSQIDVTQTTNYGSINQYSDSKVKTKLNVEGVLSGSQQVIDSLPSGVVSGSTQITDSSGIVSSSQQISNYNTFLEINGDGVISGSSQITDGSGIISSSTFVSNEQGAFTASINGNDTNIDLGLETSDSPTFQGLTLTNLSALGSGNQTALISGSGGSIGKRTLGTAAFFNTSASVGDDPNSVPTNQAVNNALIAAGAGDLTEFNPTNTFNPDNTGLVHLSSGTEVGGVRGVQGNIHVQISTGSLHFRDGVKEKLNTEGVISGSANFLNRNGDSVVSSSAQLTSDFDIRYLNTNGDNVISGSSQLEGFVSASGGFIANETIIATGTNSVTSSNILALDTINKYLGINQSNPEVTLHMTGDGPNTAQIRMEQYNDSSDAPDIRTRRYRGSSGSPSAVQAGDYLFRSNHEYWNGTSLLVGGAFAFDNTNNANRTQFSVAVDTDGTGANPQGNNGQFKIDGNDGGAITFNNAYKFPTSDGTNGQALITDGNGVLSFGGVTSLLPSGVVSGSSQVDLTQTTNYVSGIKDRLNAEGVISGSTQITNGSGIVSSSAQISNYNTFLEIEGDGVVSSSLQINDLFVGTAVSTSLDSRLDSLETDTHTHSNKSNLDSINQDLANNDNVQFANLVLTGDLTVQGTTTTLNTEELTIEDKLLSVASGSLTSAAADGGGFHISGANASITWDNGNSRLAVNKSTHFTGDVQATGDVVAYASSDRELKDNIQPISNPLEKINQISGNSFVWNEEKQNIYKGKDYGVIAQEIEEILPELVQTRENGYKAVKYDKIVSLLIEGIKELTKEVVELKNKIGE